MSIPRRALACAPSNIALIKYMGKHEPTAESPANLPLNGSLSLTLDRLASVFELTPLAGNEPLEIVWVPELPRCEAFESPCAGLPLSVPELGEAGARKLIVHSERMIAALAPELTNRWRGRVEIRSANSFPMGAGIASSASAFAALTLAWAQALGRAPRQNGDSSATLAELARLSRQGSGSSCRSLDGPWVEWEGQDARVLTDVSPKVTTYVDHVLVFSSAEKSVGSSEAHRRVLSSPKFAGRVERAERRRAQLKQALQSGDQSTIAQIAWDEMLDMHELFHTARPPFSYWSEQTRRWLELIAAHRQHHPEWVVTMDAGPNIHVLVPSDESPTTLATIAAWTERLSREGVPAPERVLVDACGHGAQAWSARVV